ncbi:DNA-binding protein inhibitor ID-4 [Trichomycterus rosablanca]|uniref:DNA-binding protein inhibitor ID-4 n=1 Tax=Trichomycterus rosablanca TaxID=2290929 RepID=UPI002F34F3D1
MKATSPARSRKDACGVCADASEGSNPSCVQLDMNDCYSRLKRLVPTIPQNRRVSRVEILQHVIDYILDLQLELSERTDTAAWPRIRTPLSALNTEQGTPVINKQEDSILCR